MCWPRPASALSGKPRPLLTASSPAPGTLSLSLPWCPQKTSSRACCWFGTGPSTHQSVWPAEKNTLIGQTWLRASPSGAGRLAPTSREPQGLRWEMECFPKEKSGYNQRRGAWVPGRQTQWVSIALPLDLSCAGDGEPRAWRCLHFASRAASSLG